MEKEGIRATASEPEQFLQTVRKAQNGDKESLDEILNYFTNEIEYLSKYIMLPREDAIQSLKIELINIIYDQL